MDWKTMLAYVTGSVDEQLLRRNEYIVAENRILRARLPGRVPLSDGERRTLAEIGKRLGRQALAEVASLVRPETILAWHRRLVARKFDGSKQRTYPGRPRVAQEIEQLIVQFATDNRDWGYDRIAGALANLGYAVSDQTVGNILQRYGIPPAPELVRGQLRPHPSRNYLMVQPWLSRPGRATTPRLPSEPRRPAPQDVHWALWSECCGSRHFRSRPPLAESAVRPAPNPCPLMGHQAVDAVEGLAGYLRYQQVPELPTIAIGHASR